MERNTSAPESHACDHVRFQLSLLRLLFSPNGPSAQVNELECLLSDPASALQSR